MSVPKSSTKVTTFLQNHMLFLFSLKRNFPKPFEMTCYFCLSNKRFDSLDGPLDEKVILFCAQIRLHNVTSECDAITSFGPREALPRRRLLQFSCCWIWFERCRCKIFSLSHSSLVDSSFLSSRWIILHDMFVMFVMN